MKKLFFVLITMVSLLQAGVDNPLVSYYTQWKANYLVEVNPYQMRVATDKKDPYRTVSEGQGYGMLIVSMMASHDSKSQAIFDALFRFSRAHPSHISKDLMSFEFPEKKVVDSAFDGDADIAYALLVADRVWGSGGEVNYQAEAQKIIDAIWGYTIGKESLLPLLGDWVDPNGQKYNQYTVRTSDFMIGHFKAFANFTKEAKWNRVAEACQIALMDVQDMKTGLVPDFIVYDTKEEKFVPAPEGFLEQYDGAYHYNACRVPWRLGVDVLNTGDILSKAISDKLFMWIKAQSGADPVKIKSGWALDGTVHGDYFTIAFTAPFGVAAQVNGDTLFAQKIYDEVIKRSENYYEDSIALLTLLSMKGYFIDPTQKRSTAQ